MAENKKKKEPSTVEGTLEETKMDELSKALDKLIMENPEIELGVIAIKFKDEEEPRVWRKGHFYDSAKLLNNIMNAYRAKASMDLGL